MIRDQIYPSLQAIADRLGFNKSRAWKWIKYFGLPAFQEPPALENSPWILIESDLIEWLPEFKRRCLDPDT